MFDPKNIDELANRLSSAIPPGLNTFREDMEKNFRAILQSVLGKLDLVTREEFEVQKAVLIKTRHKLEAMETLVTELESKIKAP
jgi:BMFP domain-containing protein YqiC